MMKCKVRSRQMNFLALAAAAVLAAALVACGGGGGGSDTTTPPHNDAQALTTQPGTGSGAPAAKTIGAAGGSLTSADGRVTIDVPAGAVDADTAFTITPVTNPADNAVATYTLEPEGLTFASPVTLTFNVPEAGDTRIGIEGIGIAYHDADGHWQWLDGVASDATVKTLSVQIEHFSEYSALEGLQISPVSANVKVGETLQLQVKSCRAPSDMGDDDPLAPLVFECYPLGALEAGVSNWSVNGVAGGNATVGTITSGSDPNATFTAPSRQPDPKTVKVTVDAWDPATPGDKVWLCSLINIGDSPGYSGQFNVTSAGPYVWPQWTATGTATWTLAENGEYTVNATITPDQTEFDVGDAHCVLNQSTQTYENLGQIKDWADPPTVYWLLNVQWSATCTDDNGSIQVQNFLSILWSSGCAGIGIVEWAPVDDSAFPDHLDGSYTFPSATCTTIYPGMPTATVDWDFVKQN